MLSFSQACRGASQLTKELAFQYDGTFYRSIGDFIGKNYVDYGFTKGTVQEVDFLTELLNLPVGAKILDVGCRSGRHSLEFARRRFHVVGRDISDRFVEIANQTAHAQKLAAEFFVQDARLMQFDREFDAAICLCDGAFGLAGSDRAHKQILKNTFGALKSGGQFVLSTIHSYSVAQQKPSAEVFDPYTATSRDVSTLHSPDGERRVWLSGREI